MLSGRDECYLSPALLRALSNKELKPQHDYFKSDVFSLGITLLEAATLRSGNTVYDWDNFRLVQAAIEDLLSRAGQRYSAFFVNVIRDLLIFEENQRPCFEDIHAVLLPYQDSIQNFAQFDPTASRLAQLQPVA